MTWDPEVPYDELPLLPPPGDQESRAVLKATIAARASLAALDQAARLLPDPAVLLNAATLLEAQASSEIENIVTTADELFRFAGTGDAGDQATKEALRYRAPSWPAPPEGVDVITAKLTNWEEFLHDDALGLDPLVRMSIAHYQFEAIHPFHDGNGRTGRIINILALVEEGLIAEPVLYLSRYLIRHKSEYYRLLNDVTRAGAWQDWILYMLRAVDLTSRSTLVKIAGIRTVQEEVSEAARRVTRGGRDAVFLSLLFEQPYVRIGTVVERCGVSRPTATGWLADLARADVLSERRVGRERLFVNQRFLEVLLDDELDELDLGD
ncbi:MAG: Fic family protein [Propionibacteriaceae bacterium]|nr:MAG: Fic family protein [Propionibacteriaceae bacterium]